MHKFIFASLIILILLSGCATFPVFRLKSLDHPVDIYMGVEAVKKTDDKAEVTLRFDKQSGKVYEFYLSIINKSSDSTIFNPKDIYEMATQRETEIPNNRIYAYNPEKQIERIDHEINSTIANKKTSDAFNSLAALADFALTVLTIGKRKSENERHKEEENRENLSQNIEDAEVNFQNRMNSFQNEKSFWENEALRTTNIYPFDEIGGIICLPIIYTAEIMKVVINVDGHEYNFTYSQKRY